MLKNIYKKVSTETRSGFVAMKANLILICFFYSSIFFCFNVFIQQSVCAQSDSESIEIITLEDALSTALSQNPGVNNAYLDVEKAGDEVSATRTKYFPEFNVSLIERYHLTDDAFTFRKGVFGTFDIGPIPPEDTKISTSPNFTTYIVASVAQPISQLYEIFLLIKQREIEKAIFNQNLRSKRQDISDMVKKQYYKILKSQSSLKAKVEKILFLKELDVLVDRYVQTGRALETDSLDVKARLGRIEYEAFVIENTLTTEKERLNKLLGRDIDIPFEVAPVGGPSPYTIDVNAAEEEAIEQRPEIEEALLKLEFAENEVRIEKSKYIPEIGVQFSYIGNLNIELLPENIASVGIFAKWDIFDWGRKQDKIASKRKSIIKAENNLREARSNVLIDVNEQIRNLEESTMLIGVTKLDQNAAGENLRVVMNKYKVDTTLLQDVLEAESRLEDANSKYQKAVLDYWTARAELEKALGEQ